MNIVVPDSKNSNYLYREMKFVEDDKNDDYTISLDEVMFYAEYTQIPKVSLVQAPKTHYAIAQLREDMDSGVFGEVYFTQEEG